MAELPKDDMNPQGGDSRGDTGASRKTEGGLGGAVPSSSGGGDFNGDGGGSSSSSSSSSSSKADSTSSTSSSSPTFDKAIDVQDVSYNYGKNQALKNVSLVIPRGETVAIIGPDGAGKSTLLNLITGIRKLKEGEITVLGHDVRSKEEREKLSWRVAYMPQGLGKNLYPTLSIYENIEFFTHLYRMEEEEKEDKIRLLMEATSLSPFKDRPAGKLSGGMKQKLSLCCALVNDPDLLILDEPTTGVDPLSRQQFWLLIEEIKKTRGDMTVLVTTAYMDEAMLFEHIVGMNGGRIIVNSTKEKILAETGTKDLEDAFVKLMREDKALNSSESSPESSSGAASEVQGASTPSNASDSPESASSKQYPSSTNAVGDNGGDSFAKPDATSVDGSSTPQQSPMEKDDSGDSSNQRVSSAKDAGGFEDLRRNSEPIIVAHHLSKEFGDFKAVDDVSFTIYEGEIFGFLGSNGCGKSTTMKMLTGLLEPSSGDATVLGQDIQDTDDSAKMRVGYMSQAFSLYEELTVAENLKLHCQLYQVPKKEWRARIREFMERFDLLAYERSRPTDLSLGLKQRLQLAAATLHRPKLLILDEPTSGVDPAARDDFWVYLIKLAREDKVTIFVSTHFMNEAMRCDRISFMHKGRVLSQGTPDDLKRKKNTDSLEEAFIQFILDSENSELQAAMDEAGKAKRKAAIKSGSGVVFDEKSAPHNDEASSDGVGADAGKGHMGNSREGGEGPQGQGASSPEGKLDANQLFKARLKGNISKLRKHVRQRSSKLGLFSAIVDWFKLVNAFAKREFIEIYRDPIRLSFAIFGPVVLMIVSAISFSFDVKEVRYAAFDQDNSIQSRSLLEKFRAVPVFKEERPVYSYEDVDIRMRKGTQMVIIIPDDFGKDLMAGRKPEITVHIDGTQAFVAENVIAYVRGVMMVEFKELMEKAGLPPQNMDSVVEPRFIYNQDFRSINSLTTGIISMFLLLISAMMTSLGVVREKEIGSILNFYTSPATATQFLIGKQIPYVAISIVCFALMVINTVFILNVPFKGSVLALFIGAIIFAFVATSFGLMISTMVRTQAAAMFASAIFTLIPTNNYSGIYSPISSMSPRDQFIAKIFPAGWFNQIANGSFAKNIDFASYMPFYGALILIGSVYLLVACLFLKKQEG